MRRYVLLLLRSGDDEPSRTVHTPFIGPIVRFPQATNEVVAQVPQSTPEEVCEKNMVSIFAGTDLSHCFGRA